MDTCSWFRQRGELLLWRLSAFVLIDSEDCEKRWRRIEQSFLSAQKKKGSSASSLVTKETRLQEAVVSTVGSTAIRRNKVTRDSQTEKSVKLQLKEALVWNGMYHCSSPLTESVTTV